jgi:hypothetical protein
MAHLCEGLDTWRVNATAISIVAQIPESIESIITNNAKIPKEQCARVAIREEKLAATVHSTFGKFPFASATVCI